MTSQHFDKIGNNVFPHKIHRYHFLFCPSKTTVIHIEKALLSINTRLSAFARVKINEVSYLVPLVVGEGKHQWVSSPSLLFCFLSVIQECPLVTVTELEIGMYKWIGWDTTFKKKTETKREHLHFLRTPCVPDTLPGPSRTISSGRYRILQV